MVDSVIYFVQKAPHQTWLVSGKADKQSGKHTLAMALSKFSTDLQLHTFQNFHLLSVPFLTAFQRISKAMHIQIVYSLLFKELMQA